MTRSMMLGMVVATLALSGCGTGQKVVQTPTEQEGYRDLEPVCGCAYSPGKDCICPKPTKGGVTYKKPISNGTKKVKNESAFGPSISFGNNRE